ncbi:MAG TPA: RNase adapter RapZ [Armatimonadaceae bacterium]|nr:RNase adapter RapZ [Armatimonadaceae bacterium]
MSVPTSDRHSLPDKRSSALPARVVLSGMSGAGKQLAATAFEDMGFRVVDNLPPRLLPLVAGEEYADPMPLCLVCDMRGGQIEELLPALERMEALERVRPTLLFLDASDETLVQRFKETRRTHPLFLDAGGILPAMARERALLAPIKERADLVMDTTGLAPADLRQRLRDEFAAPGRRGPSLTVTIASFGFKYGTPMDADLLFDVRFLRNPHYDDTLRPRDGRDPDVEAYIQSDERTDSFLERLYDLVGWSLPHYVDEGKAYLTIGIGCTGGRHRSVFISEKLACFLAERGYRVLLHHRDVHRATASDPEPAIILDGTTDRRSAPAAAATQIAGDARGKAGGQ